jgi:translation initiation factor 5B
MAPKKKGNKKGNDDWEAELGESIAPSSPAGDAPAADAAGDDEASAGGGGLMNLMRKNKEKRKKKGLEDGEDEAAQPETTEMPALEDLNIKQAVEANPDDEFALPEKKGKGGKGKQQQQQKQAADAKDDEMDAGGRVLTKAEKEKLKKEREKQRKKEQVGYQLLDFVPCFDLC